MYPNDQPPLQQPQQPYGPPPVTIGGIPPQPGPGVVPGTPGQVPRQADDGSKKKLLIIVASVAAVLILGLVLAVVLAGGNSGKKASTKKTTTQQATGPTPATALGLQQNIDAINQNISSLNDTSDFAPAALSDTALGHGN